MRFSRYGAKIKFALPPAPIRSRSASGDGEIRTLDPLLARQVLSQLSYTPTDAGLPFQASLPYSFLFLFCFPSREWA